MNEVSVAPLFRVKRDEIAVLKSLVMPLRAVVHPLLKGFDFLDFLLQRGERFFHLGDLRLGSLGLVLETDEMPELLRLLLVRRLSGHSRVHHPQPKRQAQQS